MKRVPGILWVALACLPLPAAADVGEAASRTALGRDSSIAVAGAENGGAPKRRDARTAVSPRRGSATPQRAVAQHAHGNADRLHSMLSANPRGRLAKASSRPVGSNHAATGGDGVVSSPRGSNPAGKPKPAVSKNASQATTGVKTVADGSRIGGPHASGLGRLGGPATGRTANSATINGTQLHRKL